MTRIPIGVIIGIAQIVAVFATVSTLLGRMYFIAYLDAVGVPRTAISLNISEYAILSPDVTLLAAGSAITSTVLWRRSRFIQLWSKLNKQSGYIGYAIAIISIVVIAILILPIVLTGSLQRYPGIMGLALLIPLTLMLAAGIILGASSSDEVKNVSDPSEAFFPKYVTRQVKRTSAYLICVLAVGLPLIYFPGVIAKFDATDLLLNAPSDTIELATPNSISLQTEKDECRLGTEYCKFKVVIVDDEFLYAHLIKPEPASETQTVYVIPMADIRSIAYESK